jgi:hypothetical protein
MRMPCWPVVGVLTLPKAFLFNRGECCFVPYTFTLLLLEISMRLIEILNCTFSPKPL